MKFNDKKGYFFRYLPAIITFVFAATAASAQTAWFIDGYHGGVYGGYPKWQTRFMVDMLRKHPDWKINLEIEPETWDTVQKTDSSAYAEFKALAADQSSSGRIEFINPDYAQSYLYNISGESIIRQFGYGIKKVRSHFPGAVFTTYSSEEPCFTSALPQILTSFGFKYASLKNPNTCFGGYAAAHGGELINWIGPDGTAIITAPRYCMEKLSDKSTWQTIGCENSPAFVNGAHANGIMHPVGMTIQDAGWKGGPFMGDGLRFGIRTIYTTWRGYFENAAKNDPSTSWKPTQEDMLVNLVWGSQVTQRIAQEVRVAENKIITAEKLSALARIYKRQEYPSAQLDSAWRTLLLSQHHDCWIVPYNGKPGETWADKVHSWTNFTDKKCDSIISVSTGLLAAGDPKSNATDRFVRVYNTLAFERSGLVEVTVPPKFSLSQVKVVDKSGREVASQIIHGKDDSTKILFNAVVPSMGYTTYRLQSTTGNVTHGAYVKKMPNGQYEIETDLYSLMIDPQKGGIIKSLKAKKLQNKEFVDIRNPRGFNELRGNFYNDGGFKSSRDQAASIQILENGPVEVKVAIKGTIDGYAFTQFLTLSEGNRRIDWQVDFDWTNNAGIGESTPAGTYTWQNPHKAFYDDRYKLLALFPLNLKGQKVYKNAPFDVTESRLNNTFFTRWDSIKNNVILNWVDVTDNSGKYGLALFSDHTTSYTHGKNFPLGLDLQYSGMGLWGKDYKINGPSSIHYAIIPHTGKWDQSGIWSAGTAWSEPLAATVEAGKPAANDMSRSFIKMSRRGNEITSMTFDGDVLLVRIFNAEGTDAAEKMTIDKKVSRVEMVELSGKKIKDINVEAARNNTTSFSLAIPRFGIRTIKLTGVKE